MLMMDKIILAGFLFVGIVMVVDFILYIVKSRKRHKKIMIKLNMVGGTIREIEEEIEEQCRLLSNEVKHNGEV